MRELVKKLIPRGLFQIIEPYGHWAESLIFNVAHGFPARNLKVIGVTGTNGKTTTCFLIHKMLTEAGYKVGLMTTVAHGVGNDIKPQVEHMTTVPVPLLMSRIKTMRDEGAEWLVLEVTSHALAQNRVWGIPFSVAVMTNITHEHLDYHKTFERYRDAKWKLFKLANRNWRGLRTGIVNADDPSAELFASAVNRPVTYGIKHGELKASHIKTGPSGSKFTARLGQEELHLVTNIPGSFNVYNALAAAGVGLAIGLPAQQIERGIAALSGVEGRMETIEMGQDFAAIVDFAHTPDSFEKLLPELKKVTAGRLIVLFGSAGRRDETKRAVQGELAGKFADVVVVTEEDDRDVDGKDIMRQIAGGATKRGKVVGQDLFLVGDRTEAIEYAVGLAKPGDTIAFLGKGHEKTIERADGEHTWDEAATVRAAIQKRLKSPA